MPEYELNSEEKLLVTWLVEANGSGQLEKRFQVIWTNEGGHLFRGYEGSVEEVPQIFPEHLDALEDEGLLRCKRHTEVKTSIKGTSKNPKTSEREVETSRRCTITEEARQAVDTSFVKPEPEPTQPSVVHQTNNFYAEVNQSAIGPNSHVELTQNLDLASVRRRIDKEGGEYADDLHELLDLSISKI